MLIIFDLDDTLIDTSGCITPVQLRRALSKMVAAGLCVDDEEGSYVKLLAIDKTTENGADTIRQFVQLVHGREEWVFVGIRELYGPLPQELQVSALPQAHETLQELAQAHILALVSKGAPAGQLSKLERSGIDSTVFSRMEFLDVGSKAPHYEALMSVFGFSPEMTLVCGDRVGRDLLPAKQLGCHTVQMMWGRGWSEACVELPACVDFTISTVSQIKEVVLHLWRMGIR